MRGISASNPTGNDSVGKPVTLESTFTITGVVTVSTGIFGKNSFYIQDETAGTNVYDGGKKLQTFVISKDNDSLNKYVKAGDSMTVTGTVWFYNGLLEFIPTDIPNVDFINRNRPTPGFKTLTTSDIALNGEKYEGQLVRISNAMLVYGEFPPIGESASIDIQDASGISCTMRVEELTNIHPTPLIDGFPLEPSDNRYLFDITGIVGQYISTSPYTGGYQILPRSMADFIRMSPVPAILIKAPVLSVDKKVFNPYKGQNLSFTINTMLGNRMMLRVFDAKGRLVKKLADYQTGGMDQTVIWDGTDDSYDKVPPGIYIVQLESLDPSTGTNAKTAIVVAAGIKLK